MGSLERRRVIDSVPGHGDDLAIGLQSVDDAKLLFGHDPREYRRRANLFRQFGVGHGLQHVTCQDAAAVDTGGTGYRPGRDGIVSGDHDDANARTPAFGNGRRHAGPQRVRKTDKAGKRKIELARVARDTFSCRRGPCDTEDPKVYCGEFHVGNDVEFPDSSSHSPDYLLGTLARHRDWTTREYICEENNRNYVDAQGKAGISLKDSPGEKKEQ